MTYTCVLTGSVRVDRQRFSLLRGEPVGPIASRHRHYIPAASLPSGLKRKYRYYSTKTYVLGVEGHYEHVRLATPASEIGHRSLLRFYEEAPSDLVARFVRLAASDDANQQDLAVSIWSAWLRAK